MIHRDQYGSTFLDANCTIRHSFDDQPAVSFENRDQWYRNGKLHRDHGPAIWIRKPVVCKSMELDVEPDELKIWLVDGQVQKILLHGQDITRTIPDLFKYVQAYNL
jgi:hypothetical protein